MNKHGALEKYVRSPDEELKFAEETAMAQTALAVADLLANTNTSQCELAQRVGVSQARISQILCADSNPTVRTMARIGYAMGRRMVIEFKRPPMACEEPKPWPRRLHSVPMQWESTDDEPEPVTENKLAG
jgi:transcriptional regulator with XRE-family HTH domain